MKVKMIRSILFVDTRATASKAAQDIVKALWEWDEKTVAQWIADLAEFDVLDVAETTKRAELRSAALAWDETAAGIKQMTQDIVRLAKVRFRKQPAKLDHFTVLKTGSRSRSGIYDQGRAAEKAWLETDPSWAPWPDMSASVLGSSLASALALGDVHAVKKALWRTAASALRNKARALDDDCVGWYAAATTKFPAGTTQGDMIRSTVPTTYNPPPEVGQAVLSHLMVQDRTVHFDCDAPHATKFTYMYQAPGSPVFVVVTALTKERSFTMANLGPGVHRFKAFGRNAGGEGAESAVLEVTIAQEQAA
jgi:hypothetical protein